MSEPIAYLRDLDGTGSLHPCAAGDPGAMPVYGGDEIERLRAELAVEKDLSELRRHDGEQMLAALNERDLFINPDILEKAADEIDCGGSCENITTDYSVNVSECVKADRGEYCPNDVAETLRALARLSRSTAD